MNPVIFVCDPLQHNKKINGPQQFIRERRSILSEAEREGEGERERGL